MVPGPVLSKSVRKELFPVSTRPPPAFPVVELGLRSEGKALVIELEGPASAPAFRRRTKRKAPMPIAARSPRPPMSQAGLSMISSTTPFSATGVGPFLGAAALGGAGFGASATFGGAGFGASATLGGSMVLAGSTLVDSGGLAGSNLGGVAGAVATLGGSAGLTGSTLAGGGGAAATLESGLVGAPALRSSRRCMSRICFSRSATLDCDSRSALSLAVSSSCSAFRRSWPPAPPLAAPSLPAAASDFESLSTSLVSAAGGAGGVTAAVATRPAATLLGSARAGMAATPPASWPRYAFQSATCVRYSWLASFVWIFSTSGAEGTLRIWPVFRRFMLLFTNADWFSR